MERAFLVAAIVALLVFFYVRGLERRKRWILILVFAALPAYTLGFAVWSRLGSEQPSPSGHAAELLAAAKEASANPPPPATGRIVTETEETATSEVTASSVAGSSATSVPAGVAPTTVVTTESTKTETRSTEPPPPSCASAWALETVDGAASLDALEDVRTASDVSSDEKLCAAAAIVELENRQFSARLERTVASESEHLSDLLLGRPSKFDSVSFEYVVAFLVFNVLLALLALRVLKLWGAARHPFPVTVQPIEAKGDLEDRAATLTDLLRIRLANTGSFPAAIVAGELSAIVVEAVGLSGESSGNWLSTLMSMLSRLVRLPHGYTVKGSAELIDGGQCRVVVAVTKSRTGETVDVLEVEGSNADEAIAFSAYEIYLLLTEQEEVRRRTPIWLAWTSSAALRGYHEAKRRKAVGDYLNAVELLEHAARHEPANMLIQLLLGDCYLWLAQGRRDENILRPTAPVSADQGQQAHARVDSERIFRRRNYLLALRAYLRAAARARESMVAMRCVALVLGYSEHWWKALADAKCHDRELFDDVVRLLDLVSGPESGPPIWASRGFGWLIDPLAVLTSPMLHVDRSFTEELAHRQGGGGSEELDFDDKPNVVAALLALSVREWSYSVRALRFPGRAALWLHLASRREVRSLMGPFNRQRMAVRKSRSAARVGVEWRLQFVERTGVSATASTDDAVERSGASADASEPSRILDQKKPELPNVPKLLELRTKHLGFLGFLWSVPGDAAQYNIAGAKALRGRVKKLQDSPEDELSRTTQDVLRYLESSMGKPLRRMPQIELDYLLVDPDFVDPHLEPHTQTTTEPMPSADPLASYGAAREFAQRFDSETPHDREIRVWGEQVGVLRRGARSMVSAWQERLRSLLADDPASPMLREVVVEWFCDDRRSWEALQQWCEHLAVAEYRNRFESLTARPDLPEHSTPIVVDEVATVPLADSAVLSGIMTSTDGQAPVDAKEREERIRSAASMLQAAWSSAAIDEAEQALACWRVQWERSEGAFQTPLNAQISIVEHTSNADPPPAPVP